MASGDNLLIRPLEGASFGALASFDSSTATDDFIAAAGLIRSELAKAGGLMVVKGLGAIANAPDELVRISRVFGPEVENYRETLTGARFFHDKIPEVLVLSNMPPCSFPPPRRPDPPVTADGSLPVRFPHQRNWHTDQSYRRPPPDITLANTASSPSRTSPIPTRSSRIWSQ